MHSRTTSWLLARGTTRSASVASILAAVLAVGCAYPRRSTSLGAVGTPASGEAPPDVWQLRLLSAELPPERRGGLPWDEDGTGPDAFVRVYRANELIYEGPVAPDTTAPSWNEVLPRNVWLPRDQELRFEVWDRDGLESDPAGIWRNIGLPATALTDADARINLSNETTLMLRISRPAAHEGTGITSYEARGDVLVVLDVLKHSPAGRAGLKEGDRIVEIGGQAVGDLGGPAAASALSLAAHDRKALTVEDDDGKHRTVELDDGYIWLVL